MWWGEVRVVPCVPCTLLLDLRGSETGVALLLDQHGSETGGEWQGRLSGERLLL